MRPYLPNAICVAILFAVPIIAIMAVLIVAALGYGVDPIVTGAIQ